MCICLGEETTDKKIRHEPFRCSSCTFLTFTALLSASLQIPASCVDTEHWHWCKNSARQKCPIWTRLLVNRGKACCVLFSSAATKLLTVSKKNIFFCASRPRGIKWSWGALKVCPKFGQEYLLIFGFKFFFCTITKFASYRDKLSAWRCSYQVCYI